MTIINYFTYTGVGSIVRKMTVINGIPFYCSSGINSNCPDTWFPFLGLNLEGWFRKPGFMKELPNLDSTIPKELFKYFRADDTRKRFTSLNCLLISSALGGGFWDTNEGDVLHQTLIALYPDFYANHMYCLQDSLISFDTKGEAVYLLEVRKINREVNMLLEKGTSQSLHLKFSASLFENALSDTKCRQEAQCFIPKKDSITLKPKYPEFPTALAPTSHETIVWPIDFEQKLHLTEAQKIETEQFIHVVYPNSLKHICTNKKYLDYSLVASQEKGAFCNHQGMTIKTYLHIKILHNGELIVYPDTLDYIFQTKDTSIFKIYNVSRGEWGVLKNIESETYIPYVKLLNNEPHILEIYDFTKYKNNLSHVGKLYHKNLKELINEKPLSIAQKKKFMLALLDGLNAIHKIPCQFDQTEGHLFHADIKLENIYYDESLDKVVIGDLESMGRWSSIISSTFYISPELALGILTLNYCNTNKLFFSITGFNKNNGQSNDIWNLGLVFASLLQEELINHDFYAKTIFIPHLNFLLDRLQLPEKRTIFLSEMASLKQEEIDEELGKIKQALPENADGETLKHLWAIVHQMLQVSTSTRANCRELLKQMQEPQKELSDQMSIGLHKNGLFSVNNCTMVSDVSKTLTM